jgi:hypothetical protein
LASARLECLMVCDGSVGLGIKVQS